MRGATSYFNSLTLIYHLSFLFLVRSSDGNYVNVGEPEPSISRVVPGTGFGRNGGMFADVFNYENIAHALRFSCEVNRQLSAASNSMSRLSPSEDESTINGSTEVSQQEELTVFHQARPRELGGKRGVLRWGPDLALYLEELYKALECSSPMCLVYALIYLDRACSVETKRAGLSVNGEVLKCPYVTPRTVHRLLLTAMVMAAKATDPEIIIKSNALGCDQYVSSSKRYAERLKAFGVSEKILAAMEAKMLAALGEEGTFVQEYQLRDCYRIWVDALSLPSAPTLGNRQESSNIHPPMGNNGESYGEAQYPRSNPMNYNGQQVQKGQAVVFRQSRQSFYVSTGSNPVDSRESIVNRNRDKTHESSQATASIYDEQQSNINSQQQSFLDSSDSVSANRPQEVSNSIGYYWT